MINQATNHTNEVIKRREVEDITKNTKVEDAVRHLSYRVSFPNPFTDLLKNNIQEITFNNPYHYWLGY